jgi:hypothetical protein
MTTYLVSCQEQKGKTCGLSVKERESEGKAKDTLETKGLRLYLLAPGEATGGAAHDIGSGPATKVAAFLVLRAPVGIRERVATQGNSRGQRMNTAQELIPQYRVENSWVTALALAQGNIIGSPPLFCRRRISAVVSCP